MNVKDTCKQRTIRKSEVRTPLLVPSFSSKGFPELPQAYSILREHAIESSLVSAYDIKHGIIAADQIFTSNVVFIDSGGYETNVTSDPSDSHYISSLKSADPWNREMHADLVKELHPTSDMVIVSFDEVGPVEEQIMLAKDFFHQFPDYSSDFLVKPSAKDDHEIRWNDLFSNISGLRHFDILGITEKELGSSFLDRCKNIVRIRKALLQSEHDIPIHVFGALEPLSALAYFLCGADIFDGLSWLRYGFSSRNDPLALYYNSFLFSSGWWEKPFRSAWYPTRLQNLTYLAHMQGRMQRYCTTGDLTKLDLRDEFSRELIAIVETAGVVMS